ncbi:MAG: PilT protein domain protein [Deltaproteobacteria bacterium]|nr:PilT protein domain protein [Deltaproteobacteria bacterium]
MPPGKLLPDTCAWIDFLRGRQTPLAVVLEQSLLSSEVMTCGVVLLELLQGIKSPREEELVQNALQALPHLEMSRDLWIKTGKLSSRLRSKGHILPLSDIIIAVLALEHNCAVLTVDRHFEVVPGLKAIKGSL